VAGAVLFSLPTVSPANERRQRRVLPNTANGPVETFGKTATVRRASGFVRNSATIIGSSTISLGFSFGFYSDIICKQDYMGDDDLFGYRINLILRYPSEKLSCEVFRQCRYKNI
jgi:hypothetical protein